ncbi:MAG: bifunctional UDP-3-O-[3-hydroxymyristoyl] N-acetylglucosamine deacetylase/3-hydroxyacyl-ACP dehydratase [Ferruginibacter sp.]|nr:bifunctional UDP-3-O-[3-hydroxymyristoyl] N-acetylglucosamine deacetylase/3-hydroxyacyl-ACP dehydratase [Ferruginibacter sp.]
MDINFNENKQHTLASSTSISGTGLHTGVLATMTLNPAGSNFGFQFLRTDLPNTSPIKADCDLVTDTSRGTTIEKGEVKISTIEHVLAALVGMGVDNCLIEVSGPEIPIIDGSSKPFTEIIAQAGVVEQDATKIWYSLDEPLSFFDEAKNAEFTAVPANEYRITTLIDFNSPVLGTQHADLKHIREFNKEIAPCRTFCFLHELEALLDNNLIKGGDINNAIVVVDKEVSPTEMQRLAKAFDRDDIGVQKEGYLNNLELRFNNEPARHKLLDVIGDLALSGYPMKAHIMANRPGHSSNVALAKMLKQHFKKASKNVNVPQYDATIAPIYALDDIEKILPHRYPFLFVDKIISLTDKEVVGIKNVTFNESFFQGHFPGNPIMPGVLQIEALAQTGGLLCIKLMPDGLYDTYFLKIDNCKFKVKVVPGDTMILKMELIEPIRRGICVMKGSVYVGNKLCTEGEFTAQMVKRS